MKILFVIFFLHPLGIFSYKVNDRHSYSVNGNDNGLAKAKRHGHYWAENGRRQVPREKQVTDSEIQEGFKDPVVFPDEATMLKMGAKAKIGAIAYVEDGKFFGKSSRGWSPFEMGPPIKAVQEYDRGKQNEANIPPTLLTKITESKMDKVKISDHNFNKHVLRKEHKNTSLVYGSLKLVGLNKPLTGDMGGLKNANYKCQREATAAGNDGIFRAFLASKSLNLAEIVHPQISIHFEIINNKGEKLFDSYDSLRNHTEKWRVYKNIITPIYSFNNRSIIYDAHWPRNLVWHGPARNGYTSSNNSDCNEWTSSDSNDTGIASDYLAKGLFHSQNETCSEELIVLCLETGIHHKNGELSLVKYIEMLEQYDGEYNSREGVDGESSSSQSDSVYEEDHTETTDSVDDSEFFI